jgi:hypothetical protein
MPEAAVIVKPPSSPVVSAPKRAASRLRRGIYIVSILIIGWLLIDGLSYYSTPYQERPHHADYRALRPAGSRGLLFGIIGAGMMVLMLVYSLRKRTRLLGRRSSLKGFLQIHIYFGVIGPLFILLHTSFKVQGLVAVSFWSMVAVALSGYWGRYLYQQIPRNIQGHEATLQEMQQDTAAVSESLGGRFGLDDEMLQGIEQLFDQTLVHLRPDGTASMLSIITADLFRPLLRRRLRTRLAERTRLSRSQLGELFELLFGRALLKRRILVLGRMQRLFHYWHVVHKPFAIVMYLIMGIHIAVALWTGYGWIG